MLADISTSKLTDADKALLAFLRATIRLFTLADPTGARKLVDDTAHAIPSPFHNCIDAFTAKVVRITS